MNSEIFSKYDFSKLLKDPKKGARRRLQIAEASIELIFEGGVQGLTYEALSKKCDIARSLIYHYFPNTTGLLLFTAGYIRYRYQSYVIEQMSLQKTPLNLMKTYIRHALLWADKFPKEASVWLVFFQQCSLSHELANLNRELVDMGIRRIETLLKTGKEANDFAIENEAIPFVARQIQLLITGGLVSRVTEVRDKRFWHEEIDNILILSLKLAGPLHF